MCLCQFQDGVCVNRVPVEHHPLFELSNSIASLYRRQYLLGSDGESRSRSSFGTALYLRQPARAKLTINLSRGDSVNSLAQDRVPLAFPSFTAPSKAPSAGTEL